MVDPQRDLGGTPVDRLCGVYEPADRMVRPALTLITPFYDAGPIFRETAATVRAQTFQQWEWIVVDDASEDADSTRLLREVAEADPRITVIKHASNRGRSVARNAAITAARTEYVYMLDQDDLLEPTALEKSLWCLITHPECGFVNGWSVAFGAQNFLWARGFEREDEFLDDNAVSGRVLIRRRVLDAVGGFDRTLTAGFDLGLYLE